MLRHLGFWGRGRMSINLKGETGVIAAEVMVPCFSFAKECRPDWAAVSALGGWVAAGVTFLAVLLPFLQGQRQRRDQEEAARFAACLSLEHFILSLIDVRARAIGSVKDVESDPTAPVVIERAQVMVVVAGRTEYPDLPAIPSLMEVRSDIAYLRRTLSVFADYVTAGETDAIDEKIIDSFHKSVVLCVEATNAVIRSSVPFIRQDLSLVFRDLFDQDPHTID